MLPVLPVRVENQDAQKDRVVAQWKQNSEFFKDYPDSLLFELLNEPLGTEWLDTETKRDVMRQEFAPLKAYEVQHNVPVHIGEHTLKLKRLPFNRPTEFPTLKNKT